MSQHCTSGGQSIGASASASVLPVHIQWFRFWYFSCSVGVCVCVCVCVCVHACESALVCLYLGVFVCTWSLGWAGACLGALCPSALCVTQCICPGVSMSPCVQTPVRHACLRVMVTNSRPSLPGTEGFSRTWGTWRNSEMEKSWADRDELTTLV